MKKRTVRGLLAITLCLLLILSAAGAETREAVIALEGMEETVEEALFESPLGFSFWYVHERLEAYHGEADNIEGVVVVNPYSDDYMVLSMITEEEAEEYTGDSGPGIAEQSAASRVQTDLYRELDGGQYYFCTLIAESGQYLLAVGQYAQEAAEGNAKLFQLALDSVAFTTGCLLRAEWGTQTPDETGRVQVILTALEPVTDVKLLRLDWESWDGVAISWEEDASLGSLGARQSVGVTLEFIGDMTGNGVMYTDEAGTAHLFALDISGEDGRLIFWKLDE